MSLILTVSTLPSLFWSSGTVIFQCDKSKWSDGRALAAAVLPVAELAGLSAAASVVDIAELDVSELDVSAVSYTHLTLPTICSV